MLSSMTPWRYAAFCIPREIWINYSTIDSSIMENRMSVIPSGLSVVASHAQCLPVRSVPEEIRVTSVRNDVIHNRRGLHRGGSKSADAPRPQIRRLRHWNTRYECAVQRYEIVEKNFILRIWHWMGELLSQSQIPLPGACIGPYSFAESPSRIAAIDTFHLPDAYREEGIRRLPTADLSCNHFFSHRSGKAQIKGNVN